MINTIAQVEPTESATDTIRDDLVDILDRARDAIQQIEVGVDDLNGCMVELIFALPDEDAVATLANELGAQANELFNSLNKQLNKLRQEIAAGGDEDDEDDEEVMA